jgi:PDZ domain
VDSNPARRLIVRSIPVLLLLSACAAQVAPERTPLPRVGEVVAAPDTCHFEIGLGLGAGVVSITSGSAADGVLQSEDVVVALDGTAIRTITALRNAVQQRQAGEQVSLDFIRNGERMTASVVLGENPDDPTRPILGVVASSQFQRAEPDEVALEGGPLRPQERLVDVDGVLYRIDAAAGRVAGTGLDTPEGPWAMAGTTLYRIERAGQDEATITDGAGYKADLEGVVGLLGVIDGDLLVAIGADEVSSLIRFDPGTGTTVWAAGFTGVLPLAAWVSPDGQRVLVATGVSSSDYGFTLLATEDGGEAPASLGQLDNQLVTGWIDDERLLVGSDELGIVLFDPVSGQADPITIQAELSTDDSVAPVGDGVSVLVGRADQLLLAGIGDDPIETRTLVSGCRVGLIGRRGG